MRIQRLAVAAFFALLFSSNLAAQRGWEAGVWGGGSNYFGDLNTNWSIRKIGVSAGAFGRFNFNDRLCLKLGAAYGNLRANDQDSKNPFEIRRNLNFKSSIFEGHGLFEFNFLPYIHGDQEFWYTPYVTAGFGIFRFNPKGKLGDEWHELRPLGTEGQFRGDEYGSQKGAFVYGVGLKMDLSYRISLNIELSMRDVWTDYLDDVAGIYPDMDDVEAIRGDLAVSLSDPSIEPKIGLSGRQRGNGKRNDMYSMLQVGVAYYFGDIRCPTITRN